MDQKGQWRLAPAYDLSFSYSPGGRWTNRHQLSVNGKQDDFTYQDLLEVAIENDIKNPVEIIDKTIDVVSRWATYAKEAGVRQQHLDTIKKTFAFGKARNNTPTRNKSKQKDITFTNAKP